MADILERLRAVNSAGDELGGDICTNSYRNPDGPEAAGLIEEMKGALKGVMPPATITEQDWWCLSCSDVVVATYTENCSKCGTYLADCQPNFDNVKRAQSILNKLEKGNG